MGPMFRAIVVALSVASFIGCGPPLEGELDGGAGGGRGGGSAGTGGGTAGTGGGTAGTGGGTAGTGGGTAGTGGGTAGTGGGTAGTGGGTAGTGGGTAGTGGGTAGTGGGTAGTGGGTAGTGGGTAGTGGGSGAISFATTIAPILKAKCSGCHGAQYEQTASAYTRLKGTTPNATACASTARLVVNNGANSLVVKKLLGTSGCGARMPIVGGAGCTGTQCVLAADITKVTQWIDQGALNN